MSWVGDVVYWLRGCLDELLCWIFGHDPQTVADHNEGFDSTWCRRCGKLLRG